MESVARLLVWRLLELIAGRLGPHRASGKPPGPAQIEAVARSSLECIQYTTSVIKVHD